MIFGEEETNNKTKHQLLISSACTLANHISARRRTTMSNTRTIHNSEQNQGAHDQFKTNGARFILA